MRGGAEVAKYIFVRNGMKCPDLLIQAIFDNLHPVGVGANLQETFFLRIEWNVQICIENHLFQPPTCRGSDGVRSQFPKGISVRICMRCPDLQRNPV